MQCLTLPSLYISSIRKLADGMKVLQVSPYFESHRGGVEIVAGMLARHLSSLEFEIAWIASDCTPPPSTSDLQVRCLSVAAWNFTERYLGFPYPIWRLSALSTIRSAIAHADIVLMHDTRCLGNIITYIYAKKLNRPIIAVQHGGYIPYKNLAKRFLISLLNKLVAKRILTGSEQAVFLCERNRRYFETSNNYTNPPMIIVNGVSHSFVPPKNKREIASLRRNFGLTGDRPLALFVGRLIDQKGLWIIRHLATKNSHIDWLIVGWGEGSPEDWNLENVVVDRSRDGLTMVDAYQAADILVLPSVGEGAMPLVILEALYCELPVLCSEETAQIDTTLEKLLYTALIDTNDRQNTLVAWERSFSAIEPNLKNRGLSSRYLRDVVRGRYSWTISGRKYATVLKQFASKS